MRHIRFCFRRPAVLAAALALAGCASQGPPPTSVAGYFAVAPVKVERTTARPAAAHHGQPRTAPQAGKREQRTAADCGSNSECLRRLKALVDDPQRSWIGTPQSAAEYAQGIRLFAYRALKSQLACNELAAALAEIAAQTAAYRQPVAGVSTEQARRVRMLSEEVARELKAERASRCAA
jgi:hypothetical protein